MKGKGKLITRTGAVCFFMEDRGDGEYFKVAIVDDNDEIVAATNITLIDAVWITKCLDSCIDTLFDHNVASNWFEDKNGD